MSIIDPSYINLTQAVILTVYGWHEQPFR